MEFQELIQARRSIRGYAAAPSHEDLAAILKNAQQAPSWKNNQPARCYVAESPEKIKAVWEKALPPFNQASAENAALIVSTYVKGGSGFMDDGTRANEIGDGWGAYDLGLHDAYLLLAASEAGYDTLIMGIRDTAVLREMLGIPETEEVMSVIAIGKRAKEPAARPRKALEETVKFF